MIKKQGLHVDMFLMFFSHPKFQIDTARNVFEGAISLNLQPKKMKALFKRYVLLSEFHDISLVT